MKNILFLSCFLLIMQGQAQSVLGSAGSEGMTGPMHVQYTIGEALITTMENDSTMLSQGFHQPALVVTALEDNFLPGTVTVFPNPTDALLNVRLAGIRLENITIALFDLTGRLLLTSSVGAELWQTNLADLPGGYYLLTVTDTRANQSNSFKIFKAN